MRYPAHFMASHGYSEHSHEIEMDEFEVRIDGVLWIVYRASFTMKGANDDSPCAVSVTFESAENDIGQTVFETSYMHGKPVTTIGHDIAQAALVWADKSEYISDCYFEAVQAEND
jgi:hypothetical protein